MNALEKLNHEWKNHIQEQSDRLKYDNIEEPSYLEDVPETLRAIYDEISLKYAYYFHKAYSKQLLIEYKGKQYWLFIDLDSGLVYYLDDKESIIESVTLGEHEYGDFFVVPKKPVYEVFGLEMDAPQWDNFGFIIACFDFHDVANEFVNERYDKAYNVFMSDFQPEQIKLKRENDVLFLVLPNGDKIRYKHLSQLV